MGLKDLLSFKTKVKSGIAKGEDLLQWKEASKIFNMEDNALIKRTMLGPPTNPGHLDHKIAVVLVIYLTTVKVAVDLGILPQMLILLVMVALLIMLPQALVAVMMSA